MTRIDGRTRAIRHRRLGALLAATVVALLSLAGTALAAPFNDDWASPQGVPLNVYWVQDNSTATVRSDELDQCGGSTGPVLDHSVWYRIPGTGGPITVGTTGPVDIVLAVYVDGDASDPANNLRCNYNSDGSGYTSITFNSVAGQRYLIQIGGCISSGCGASTGQLGHISLANDTRAFPETVGTGTATRANIYAGTDSGESLACSGATYKQTVWFRYSAPAVGRLTVTSSVLDGAVAVYPGPAPSPIGCAIGSAGSSPSGPRLSVNVAPGDYLIQVGTLSTGSANVFSLGVEFVENRDVDGDGETKDTDCNDANPAIHHGAVDIPGNGIDEDCSGADAPPDTDGDGIVDPADRCPTQNASRRDANHDGCLDLLSVSADTSLRAVPTGGGIRILSLTVTAPQGARVRVTCSRGCRTTTHTATRKGRATFPGLHNKALGSGTKVRIYITISGRIGRYFQYTITRGNFRKSRAQCLPPGSLKPRASCL